MGAALRLYEIQSGPPWTASYTAINHVFRMSSRAFAMDLEGDGDIDIFRPQGDPNQFQVAENLGTQPLTFRNTSISLEKLPSVVDHADVDNDGDEDIVYGVRFGTSSNIRALLNDGDGNFTEVAVDDSAFEQMALHLADIDGDDRADIAATGPFDDPLSDLAVYQTLTSLEVSDIRFVSDRAGNVFFPGERGTVEVDLMNGTTVTSESVTLTAQSQDGYIEFDVPSMTVEVPPPGEERTYEFPFLLRNDAPCGEEAAIDLQFTWQGDPRQHAATLPLIGQSISRQESFFGSQNLTIPDDPETPLQTTLTISADEFTVRDAEITLAVCHANGEQLELQLRAPNGQVVDLGPLPHQTCTPVSLPLEELEGSDVSGNYVLEIRDTHHADTGTLLYWSVSLDMSRTGCSPGSAKADQVVRHLTGQEPQDPSSMDMNSDGSVDAGDVETAGEAD